MAEKAVTVKYERGHSYNFSYKLVEGMYCPECGAQTVWVETGDGDYYVGPTWYCTTCSTDFNYMPGRAEPDWQTRQIVAALRDEPPPPDPEGWPPPPDPISEKFDALVQQTLCRFADTYYKHIADQFRG